MPRLLLCLALAACLSVAWAGVVVEKVPVAGTSGWKVSNEKLSFTILNLGATIHSLHVPDRSGKQRDIVLGFEDAENYKVQGPYFGAIVGRVANRLNGGKFDIDGKKHQVALNDGANSLHGGKVGFDKKVWDVKEVKDGVVLSLESKDGEEGYPGNVKVTAHYSLKGSILTLRMTATTDSPTPVSLAQHSYFNLAGHEMGSILGTKLCLKATGYMPVKSDSIPTGQIIPLAEHSEMDFSSTQLVGDKMNDMARKRSLPVPFDSDACKPVSKAADAPESAPDAPGGPTSGAPLGFDHNYVLHRPNPVMRFLIGIFRGLLRPLRPVATVTDPKSGTQMRLLSDAPGVQFYSGNFLNGEAGKGGVKYQQHAGLCLETQTFPDSIGSDPASDVGKGATRILRPGQTYRHTVVYKFETVECEK